MGFMDKAKKIAEQAQQKLDEAQKNFSQSGSPQAQPEGGGVRYDEHGRPIQDAPPAGATAPPPAQPTADPAGTPPPPPAQPSADPATPIADPAAPQGEEPAGPTPASPAAPAAPAAPEPPPSEGDGPDSSPDPFKPLQQ